MYVCVRAVTAKETAVKKLALALALVLLLPLSATATILCVPDDIGFVIGDYETTFHPNIADSIGAVSNPLNVLLNCTDPTQVYCLNWDVDLCFPAEYEQAPDVTSPEIIWILNNYYPAVPGMPSELPAGKKRGAAVQLAIWHFHTGVDISTGGIDIAVFDAARAIIAAAGTATVPATPTTLVLTPAYMPPIAPGTEVTVTATLYDQNGNPMPGVPVSYEITHIGSGNGTTDGAGQFAVTWIESSPGYDVLTVTVDYTIPTGLRWISPGCQDLIQIFPEDGTISAVWGDTDPVATEETSWGGIKSMHK